MPVGAAGVHSIGGSAIHDEPVACSRSWQHRETLTAFSFAIPASSLASDCRTKMIAIFPKARMKREEFGVVRALGFPCVGRLVVGGNTGLNQRTSRGGGYGREIGMIDLGHEPPLSVDGSEAAVIDRRRVSVQWFSGTILTGLCGAALIGGAVFASLDGEMTFARVPERVETALRGAFGAGDRGAVSLHKSDRLPPPGEATASRNIVRVSTVTRVGNRDVMRV